MDTLTPEQRSKLMARVRSRDTRPEMIVRRLVYSLGYRYRLHDTRLPGTPDLVFRSRHKVIFVHGCFWHQHDCPNGMRMPKSRAVFWQEKLSANVARDERNIEALAPEWQILVIWECEIRDIDSLRGRIIEFMEAEHEGS